MVEYFRDVFDEDAFTSPPGLGTQQDGLGVARTPPVLSSLPLATDASSSAIIISFE